MLRQIARLAVKDWRLFFADPRAAALSFLVPILLASAFGLIFRQSGERLTSVRLPIVVVNEDSGPLAERVVADLLHHEQVDGLRADRQTARELVTARTVGVAVILPRGLFSGDVPAEGEEEAEEPLEQPRRTSTARSKPAVEIVHHPLATLEAQWAEGLLTEAAMKRLAERWLGPLAGRVSLDRPFEITNSTLPSTGSSKFDSISHSFCGMTLQYLLFWGMEAGLLLLRERQRGIWQRLRVAPLSLATLLLGKIVAIAGIALAMIVGTIGFGVVVFGVSLTSDWLGLIALAVAVSLLAATAGLLVAALGGTEARARSVSILVILTVSMLGGLWLPGFLLPEWVRTVSLALPTSWAMQAFDALTWQSQGLAAVWPALLAVFGYSGLFGVIAWWRFSSMEAALRRGGSA